jgi:hypothetical protein
VVAAYTAVNEAGLLGEVLAVLAQNPEAWDAILAGPGTLRMTTRTTLDGQSWDTRSIPFLGRGELVASDSTADRLALLFSERGASAMTLATTSDLVTWTVTVLPTPSSGPNRAVRLTPVAGGWYVMVIADIDASSPSAWTVDDAGTILEAVAPGLEACCEIEPTDAGLLAYGKGENRSSDLWFSADGRRWELRGLAEPGQVVVGAAGVEGGVVLETQTEAGVNRLWQGGADARDWNRVSLPEEIAWNLWLQGRHWRGIAQYESVPGTGRGGSVETPIARAEVEMSQIERALRDGTYLLSSFDGIEWNVSIVEPLGEVSRPGFTLNGTRALFEAGGEFRVVDLDR